MYDVIIVGGGPAGLSAATILGRCRRRVLLCDDGRYRNDASRALHGYLTRDGVHPAELRRIGREQLARYDIEIRNIRVTHAEIQEGRFELTLEDDSRLLCRRLLLATGVVDKIPEVEGMERFFGNGVYHCPYCDGWEVRDRAIAAFGKGKSGAGLALSLRTWSADVTLLTDGPGRLAPEEAERLARHGISVRSSKIIRLEGSEGLEQVIFRDGTSLPVRAIFLSAEQSQRCDLASGLGCIFNKRGTVRTGELEKTNIPGLFVAGDASRDVQLAVVAAAEGAKAAIAINTSLQQEDGT